MNKSTINIGLIGFGTIGSGVVKVLQEKAKFFEENMGLKLILKKIVSIIIHICLNQSIC